jgi:hypothetical protein
LTAVRWKGAATPPKSSRVAHPSGRPFIGSCQHSSAHGYTVGKWRRTVPHARVVVPIYAKKEVSNTQILCRTMSVDDKGRSVKSSQLPYNQRFGSFPTTLSWNLIAAWRSMEGIYCSVIFTLAYPLMFSMHVLAFGLYVPLLALASPTPSSQYQFPPELSPQKLSLVRENAIKISNERSVHDPTSPSPRHISSTVAN